MYCLKLMNNGMKMNKGHNINHSIKRKYQSILQPPQPPSAVNYQLNLLRNKTSNVSITTFKSTRSGIFATLLSHSHITKFNLWSLRHPIILAAIVQTLRNGVSDYTAQSWIEKKDWSTFNWSRCALFTLFGFVYCGLIQYGIYSKLYPLIFNQIKNSTLRTCSQTFTDLAIHSTFVYFPMFYIFKGCVYAQDVSMDVVKDSLHQYFMINFKDDMKALYKVWFPAMSVMFAFVPNHFRVPYLSAVGFCWLIFLSLYRGENEINGDIQNKETKQTIEFPIPSITIKRPEAQIA